MKLTSFVFNRRTPSFSCVVQGITSDTADSSDGGLSFNDVIGMLLVDIIYSFLAWYASNVSRQCCKVRNRCVSVSSLLVQLVPPCARVLWDLHFRRQVQSDTTRVIFSAVSTTCTRAFATAGDELRFDRRLRTFSPAGRWEPLSVGPGPFACQRYLHAWQARGVTTHRASPIAAFASKPETKSP